MVHTQHHLLRRGGGAGQQGCRSGQRDRGAMAKHGWRFENRGHGLSPVVKEN
jgi:hypothetical protein